MHFVKLGFAVLLTLSGAVNAQSTVQANDGQGLIIRAMVIGNGSATASGSNLGAFGTITTEQSPASPMFGIGYKFDKNIGGLFEVGRGAKGTTRIAGTGIEEHSCGTSMAISVTGDFPINEKVALGIEAGLNFNNSCSSRNLASPIVANATTDSMSPIFKGLLKYHLNPTVDIFGGVMYTSAKSTVSFPQFGTSMSASVGVWTALGGVQVYTKWLGF